MKNISVQYIVILLAVLFAARCINHLLQIHGWQSLAFIMFKNIAVGLLVAYLFRLSRESFKSGKSEIVNLSVLAISFTGQSGFRCCTNSFRLTIFAPAQNTNGRILGCDHWCFPTYK